MKDTWHQYKGVLSSKLKIESGNLWDELRDVVPEEILRIGKEAIEMLPMPMQWKSLVDRYGLMEKKMHQRQKGGAGGHVLSCHDVLFKKKKRRERL